MKDCKKAIVMGATSGIGREVAILLARAGYSVGVAGRREHLLAELVESVEGIIHYKVIDVNADSATDELQELIDTMGGVDLYFHSSGIGYQNTALDEHKEIATVATNALGFSRMVGCAYRYFERKGSGHIAIISSIAGTKGLGAAPAYSATKRFQNVYMECLMQLSNMKKKCIYFTDIRPGFVATDLLDDKVKYPMLMDKHYVAERAVEAVLRKKRVAIIDWRYALLVSLWRLLPSWLWVRLRINI